MNLSQNEILEVERKVEQELRKEIDDFLQLNQMEDKNKWEQ